MSDGFDLSMAITGDASSAVAAARGASVETLKLAAAQSQAVVAADNLSTAQTKLAAATEASGSIQASAAATYARAQLQLAQASLSVEKAQANLSGSLKEGGGRFGGVAIAAAEAEHSIRAFADSILAGQSPIRAFSQELPRLAQAAGIAGGALGAVGEFLTGPWGIAATIAVSALAPFIGELFDTSEQSKATAKAFDDLAKSEINLGQYIDSTTGKLREQAKAAAEAAAASIPGLITQQQGITGQNVRGGFQAALDLANENRSGRGYNAVGNDITAAIRNAGGDLNGATGSISQLLTNIKALDQGNPIIKSLTEKLGNLSGVAQQSKDKTAQLKSAEDQYQGSLHGGITLTDQVIQNQIELATAHDTVSKAQYNLDIANQRLNATEKTDFTPQRTANLKKYEQAVISAQNAVDKAQASEHVARTRAPKAAPSYAGIIQGVHADLSIASDIIGEVPSSVHAADAEVNKLQADIVKLQSIKKGPDFTATIGQLRTMQDAVRDFYDDKPFRDFIRSQNESLAVSKLQAAGYDDDATALQEIFNLMKQQKPLDADHVAQIQASVAALREEKEAQAALAQSRQQDLAALGSIQDAITGVLGGTNKLKDLPKQFLASFKQLEGQQLFQSIFGKAFQDLKNQINGVDKVMDPSELLATALTAAKPPVDNLASSAGTVTTAFQGLTDAANIAANALGGASGGGGASAANFGSFLPSGEITGTPFGADFSLPTAANDASQPGDIVVTARKQIKATNDFVDAVSLFNKTGKSIGGSIDKVVDPNGGIFAKIGGGLGTALKGASEGAAINSIAKPLEGLLGIKNSTTGAELGGAAGSYFGPLGTALGSIAGGIIGGLFKKSKKGGATITSATSDPTIFGNSSTLESTAGTLAGSVQSGLQSIASQLGGTLGSFSGIAIGQYNKSFRVQTDGSTHLGGANHGAADAVDFGTDSAAAISYAIQQAVAKGAVTGLDAAVQKALASSTDIDKGIAEALQVQKVEALIGGIGYTLKQTFATFDATAKANYDTAVKYGLDVVAEEKATADARTALVASTLKQSVGSLQDIITSLASGDDFEGSAVDKRNAILAQISMLTPKAQAGDQDSIDSLATYYQNLLDTTKDAFGTAGTALTGDRSLVSTGAQAVIQAENDRINAAAGTSSTSTTTAVAATTAAVNESNDLLAVNNAKLANIESLLSTISVSGSLITGGRLNVRVSAL